MESIRNRQGQWNKNALWILPAQPSVLELTITKFLVSLESRIHVHVVKLCCRTRIMWIWQAAEGRRGLNLCVKKLTIHVCSAPLKWFWPFMLLMLPMWGQLSSQRCRNTIHQSTIKSSNYWSINEYKMQTITSRCLLYMLLISKVKEFHTLNCIYNPIRLFYNRVCVEKKGNSVTNWRR